MKFSEVVAAIKTGLAPKTLDQAKATVAAAQPALDSVAALFAAASLDLDAMLAAGPDSLKAHIDGLTAEDGELATAREEITTLKASLATANTDATTARASLKTANDLLTATHASIGFDPNAKDKDGNAQDFKSAFSAHVAKEAALLLAKDGRPPVGHLAAPAAGKDAPPNTSGLKGVAKTQAAFAAKHKGKTAA